MKSCIIVKHKKHHVRNYKRTLKNGRGKSKLSASALCWFKNLSYLGVLVMMCLMVMPFVSCQGEPVASKLEEAPIVLSSTSIALDGQMRGVSKYIYKKQKIKSIHTADYLAFSIVDLARQNNIPIDLLVGLIEVESNFNTYALSPKKAKGLMQVCDLGRGYDKTKRKYSEVFDQSRIYDVGYNLKCGIAIFRDKIKTVQTYRLKNKKHSGRSVLEEALFLYVGRDTTYIQNVIKRRHEFSVFVMGVA